MGMPARKRSPEVGFCLLASYAPSRYCVLFLPPLAGLAARAWDSLSPRQGRALAALFLLTSAGWYGWAWTGRWPVFAAAAFLGAVCAVVFERLALAAGRWSYTDRMPIVPVLGVGLWPLLQLTLLVPVAWAIAAWWAGRVSGTSAAGGRGAQDG